MVGTRTPSYRVKGPSRHPITSRQPLSWGWDTSLFWGLVWDSSSSPEETHVWADSGSFVEGGREQCRGLGTGLGPHKPWEVPGDPGRQVWVAFVAGASLTILLQVRS